MSTERRGRPRSEAARVAILGATRDLVGQHGYDGVTVAGIAERAGTGVQTIYRWWSDKAAIVAECVLENLVAVDLVAAYDTGDAVADLRGWLTESYRVLGGTGDAALFRALAVAASKDRAVADRLDSQLGTPLRSALERLLARGVETDQFRKDIDADAAADVLLGAMVMAIVTGRDYSDSRADAVADIILNGLLKRL
jgi:AcrR family transcriptional regulator